MERREWRPTVQGHLTFLVLLSLAFWQHVATAAWLIVNGTAHTTSPERRAAVSYIRLPKFGD